MSTTELRYYALSSQPRQRVARATRPQMAWLCFLILSFFYELPIWELTPFDRVNPRLFDVATVLGLIWILPKFPRRQPVPELFKWWTVIVFWFAFCAILWSLRWLPWDVGRFSLFYAAKYLQGLFVIYLVTGITLSARQKGILHNTVIAGGVLIGLYAIPEFIRADTVRYIAGGKLIQLRTGTVLGPLGSTYSHIANLSTLAFTMTLALFVNNRHRRYQWGLLLISLFVAWPAALSGSRTGLLGIGVVFIAALIYIPSFRTKATGGLLAAALFLGLLAGPQFPTLEDLKSSSPSIERLLSTEESEGPNTIKERIRIGSGDIQGYTVDLYEWQGWLLPLFGGGFYVVPHSHSGLLDYRIGYGIHNGYLFPMEQGGIVAFALFIGFLVCCFRSLRCMKQTVVTEDAAFATGLWLYFLLLIIQMWYSAIIWLGQGTVNLSTFLVLMLILACRTASVRLAASSGRAS